MDALPRARINQALSEIARVLAVGGRLVAVTNYRDHLAEARALVGFERPDGGAFPGEDAPDLLRRHLRTVEIREASGTIRFPDADSLEPLIRSWQGSGGHFSIPQDTVFPFVVRRRPVILVATKA